MSLERVLHGSEAYYEMVELRRRVLRRPLGLDFTPEQLATEAGDIHLAVRAEGRVIGCLLFTKLQPDRWRMRQVAVDPECQRQGIGSELVRGSERLARAEGVSEIVLHARQTAVDFYLRLGYEIFGDPFEEVGIPHRSMRKRLQPGA
jgi:ribosomal protein S18 acetylase RimI-like enzyme